MWPTCAEGDDGLFMYVSWLQAVCVCFFFGTTFKLAYGQARTVGYSFVCCLVCVPVSAIDRNADGPPGERNTHTHAHTHSEILIKKRFRVERAHARLFQLA